MGHLVIVIKLDINIINHQSNQIFALNVYASNKIGFLFILECFIRFFVILFFFSTLFLRHIESLVQFI